MNGKAGKAAPICPTGNVKKMLQEKRAGKKVWEPSIAAARVVEAIEINPIMEKTKLSPSKDDLGIIEPMGSLQWLIETVRGVVGSLKEYGRSVQQSTSPPPA